MVRSCAAAADQAGVTAGHAQAIAPPFSFASVGREAGLAGLTVFGGRETNRYLLETTGCGVAMFDYDADGLQDLFFVNGTTLEGFPKGQEPRPHLYRNTGGARFEDVTTAAGLNEQFGWGQGACAGDYDNDGFPDLFVTYYGRNRLFRNTGRGRFEEVTDTAGVGGPQTRWGTGCAFLDYDRDGRLDLFAANYIDSRSRDGTDARQRSVPVQRRAGGLWPAGAEGWPQPPLSESRGRPVR